MHKTKKCAADARGRVNFNNVHIYFCEIRGDFPPATGRDEYSAVSFFSSKLPVSTVSYTHLTLPTILLV